MNTKQTHTHAQSAVKSASHAPIIQNSVIWMACLILAIVLLTVSTAQAQNRPISSSDQRYQANGVVIYSECGFRGQSQIVGVGEHSKIDNLRFPNDQMSSIRVPAGLEVIIYEDSKFRGAYARLNQDVDCFDRSWDNTVSSMRVSGSRAGYNPGYPTPNAPNPSITVNNVGYVTFANSELRRVNSNTWALGTRNQNSAITNFNVANRDQTSLYLQSTMSAESIRINLQANTVTYFTANGLTQSYPIQQMQAGVNMPNNAVAPKPAPQNPVVGNEPNRRISGQCFNYRAYTRGGNGGLRFLGKDVVERFSTSPVTGKVCHSGALSMEITKTESRTDVIVEIQGRSFRFAANEKEDRLLNNWYRKDVRLVVGN